MTKYVLKKDTPFYKKGTEFCEDWFRKGVLLDDYSSVVANLNELDNPDEWFEEVKSGWWKPKFDEMYYFLTNTGKVGADPWCNDELDEYRYSIGECFKTEKAAEAWRDYRMARATVSRDEGFMKGTVYDGVYSIFMGETLRVDDCPVRVYANTLYFDTREHAIASLQNHTKEWEVITSYDWSLE